MAKISKTFSLENDTIKKIVAFKTERKFSSDSAALENIIIEWAATRINTNTEIANLDIDELAKRVAELLANKSEEEAATTEEDKTEQENAIKDIFASML